MKIAYEILDRVAEQFKLGFNLQAYEFLAGHEKSDISKIRAYISVLAKNVVIFQEALETLETIAKDAAFGVYRKYKTPSDEISAEVRRTLISARAALKGCERALKILAGEV